MDRILSARVDESVVSQISALARRLGASKKKVIEEAIQTFAAKVNQQQQTDIFAQTCGAWRRRKTAGGIAEEARKAFREAIKRGRP